jgi:(p)ppGpp synthase/HD superfamily hydrolase
MRTIAVKSLASQVRIAKETLQFFVPLARQLGLIEAAEELKNRSFAVMRKYENT